MTPKKKNRGTPKPKKNRRSGRSRPAGRDDWSTCPTTQKRSFKTEADATVAAVQLSRTRGSARAYKCPFCDYWHMTTSQRR